MDTAGRKSDIAVGKRKLGELMEAEPYNFHFFQMVRLLEKLFPERKPVGIFTSPQDEVVRFTATPTLQFPASELGEYVHQDNLPSSLEVHFLGLNVVNGPMPRSYTEILLERKRSKDHATLEFFDLFNHRIASLFYRAWTKYRFFIAYEKSQGAEDEITQRLYDLIGMGTPHLRGSLEVPDETCIYYAGLLAQQTRTVEGLRQILQDYFGVQVEIRQFTGSWVRLPPEQRTILRDGVSLTECLGIGTVVGGEVWEQEGTMTVRLGPMPLSQYRQFLPGAQGMKLLESWLRFFSRRSFDFVVQLILARDEVPQTNLASSPQRGGRLGYESWLKIKPMQRDPDETTYLVT